MTAVIAQRVRPERTDEFRVWQKELNRVVAAFAGFLGTEVVEPTDGGDQWTIVYRFDSVPTLDAWLTSPERRKQLERAAELVVEPARQRILVARHDQELITVVVSHLVRADREGAFRTFQQRMTDAERAFPGFRGAELLPPVPGVQEAWTALYRFDTSAHLDAWLQSTERAALLAASDEFGDFELHRVSNPFGSWFSLSDQGAEAGGAATWKTALSVLVGLYPTTVLLTVGISELWPGADLWQSLLLGNVLSVTALTWVVMPIVTRAMRFWLAPATPAERSRSDVVGAAISIGFVTLAAIVFWLGTTVIWKLP
jgi:antibiotic biosynthesis monooxygenase (ABM) superfamily enzyme